LSIPYIGKEINWVNGLYDSICAIVIFPAIVYIGASGTCTSSISDRICGFLGKISYPVYIIQYPIMYLFYSWLWNNGLTFSEVWPVTIAIFLGVPVLAYACLELYESPVRKKLSKIW
jgi:peptidoglycan/LPS O-acetylase OafA/YrhL